MTENKQEIIVFQSSDDVIDFLRTIPVVESISSFNPSGTDDFYITWEEPADKYGYEGYFELNCVVWSPFTKLCFVLDTGNFVMIGNYGPDSKPQPV